MMPRIDHQRIAAQNSALGDYGQAATRAAAVSAGRPNAQEAVKRVGLTKMMGGADQPHFAASVTIGETLFYDQFGKDSADILAVAAGRRAKIDLPSRENPANGGITTEFQKLCDQGKGAAADVAIEMMRKCGRVEATGINGTALNLVDTTTPEIKRAKDQLAQHLLYVRAAIHKSIEDGTRTPKDAALAAQYLENTTFRPISGITGDKHEAMSRAMANLRPEIMARVHAIENHEMVVKAQFQASGKIAETPTKESIQMPKWTHEGLVTGSTNRAANTTPSHATQAAVQRVNLEIADFGQWLDVQAEHTAQKAPAAPQISIPAWTIEGLTVGGEARRMQEPAQPETISVLGEIGKQIDAFDAWIAQQTQEQDMGHGLSNGAALETSRTKSRSNNQHLEM